MPLTADPVFTLRVDLAETIDVGPVPAGHRRIIPIIGGVVEGPELSGIILSGGADWNLMGTDGAMRLWARYDFRTDDGAIVGVVNEATHWPAAAGTPAGDGILTRPVFEASAGAPAWLNAGTFAGVLRRDGSLRVAIEVYRLSIQP